ncbi:hypothetical protein BDF22DRAFT_741448 [Syncephalis plumigaleata]|nr:hypothetical protein BDF22DRAFT_741448 [Syncephalis plumigaleata]
MSNRSRAIVPARNQFNGLVLYSLFVVIPAPLLYILNQACFGYALDGLHYTLFQFIAYAWLPWLGIRLGLARPIRTTAIPETIVQRRHVGSSTTTSNEAVGVSSAVDNAALAPALSRQLNGDVSIDDDDTIIATPEHQYTAKCNEICKRFLELADIERGMRPGAPEADETIWEPLLEENTPKLLRIYKHKSLNFCYRLITTLPAPVGMSFDLLADASRRPEWDPMCEKAYRLEDFDTHTHVQYALLRAVWPTSARDLCILSHCRPITQHSVRGLMNVTCSVEHEKCPPAGIAGQLVAQDPDTPNITRVIQIIDGDLGGWIPASVVKHVAYKAFPQSFRRLGRLLSSMPVYDQSRLFPNVSLTMSNDIITKNLLKSSDDDIDTAVIPAPAPTPVPTPALRTEATEAVNGVTIASKSPSSSSTNSSATAVDADSATTIALLNARVRRLETQMIHLVGQWPPPRRNYIGKDNQQRAVDRSFSFRRFLGRFLLPTTLVGAATWVAVIVFLAKKRWI